MPEPTISCVHPHQDRGTAWLLDEPLTPRPPHTMAVLTDAGWVWWHGVAETQRGVSAQYNLGRRAVDAGLATEYRIEQHDRDNDYGLPQVLLSIGLAVAEGRFCVAARVAEQWGLPFRVPGAAFGSRREG